MDRKLIRDVLAVGLVASLVAGCGVATPRVQASAAAPSSIAVTAAPSNPAVAATAEPVLPAAPARALHPTPDSSLGMTPPDAGGPLPSSGATGSAVSLHVPILMYHRIVDSAVVHCGMPGLCVAPATFSAQLDTLAAAGWHTITMATLAVDLATGATPPPRTLVLTFDDGYRDGVTNALPILRRHGFVATFYVVTGRLQWANDLQPRDLVTLAAAGMEIGDHTVSHVNLNHLADAGLAIQVNGAAATIQSIVGRRPTTFAYPFGDRDATVIAAVASAGFGAAVTNRNFGPETWTNRFQLPRSEVGPYTTPQDLLRRVSAY